MKQINCTNSNAIYLLDFAGYKEKGGEELYFIEELVDGHIAHKVLVTIFEIDTELGSDAIDPIHIAEDFYGKGKTMSKSEAAKKIKLLKAT